MAGGRVITLFFAAFLLALLVNGESYVPRRRIDQLTTAAPIAQNSAPTDVLPPIPEEEEDLAEVESANAAPVEPEPDTEPEQEAVPDNKKGNVVCRFGRCIAKYAGKARDALVGNKEARGQPAVADPQEAEEQTRKPSLRRRISAGAHNVARKTREFFSAAGRKMKKLPGAVASAYAEARDILDSKVESVQKAWKSLGSGKRMGVYKLKKLLGQGSFGKVVTADNEMTGEEVVIKVMADREERDDELKITRDLNATDHVVKCDGDCRPMDFDKCPFKGETASCHTLALRLYKGGSLDSFLQDPKYDSDPLTNMMVMLNATRGLSNMCAQGVIHRDLKPGNILIQKEGNKIVDTVLGDLGQSIHVKVAELFINLKKQPAVVDEDGEPLRCSGTALFWCPEHIEKHYKKTTSIKMIQFKVTPWNLAPICSCDIYAMALVMLQVASRDVNPFMVRFVDTLAGFPIQEHFQFLADMAPGQLLHRVAQGGLFNTITDEGVSDEVDPALLPALREIVLLSKRMLNMTAASRPSPVEVVDALRHIIVTIKNPEAALDAAKRPLEGEEAPLDDSRDREVERWLEEQMRLEEEKERALAQKNKVSTKIKSWMERLKERAIAGMKPMMQKVGIMKGSVRADDDDDDDDDYYSSNSGTVVSGTMVPHQSIKKPSDEQPSEEEEEDFDAYSTVRVTKSPKTEKTENVAADSGEEEVNGDDEVVNQEEAPSEVPDE